MTHAFFLPEGESDGGLGFLATDHTRGPWDPRSQHAGPPAALIGHVLEARHPREEMQFARLTFEILGPVPVARLHVVTDVVRGGRSVELLAASLRDDGGNTIMTANAWRIRTADVPLTDGLEGDGIEGERVDGPDTAPTTESFFRDIDHTGYVQAMETRFVQGDWADPGPAVAWLRMRHPLVPGADPSPLERVLIAADSGNGVSARFDGLFINPDLTVYLTRPAVGDWVCLQARTTVTNHGIGLATTVLHDRRGPLGRGLQSLLLDKPSG